MSNVYVLMLPDMDLNKISTRYPYGRARRDYQKVRLRVDKCLLAANIQDLSYTTLANWSDVTVPNDFYFLCKSSFVLSIIVRSDMFFWVYSELEKIEEKKVDQFFNLRPPPLLKNSCSQHWLWC